LNIAGEPKRVKQAIGMLMFDEHPRSREAASELSGVARIEKYNFNMKFINDIFP
jgi:hypothetical protein